MLKYRGIQVTVSHKLDTISTSNLQMRKRTFFWTRYILTHTHKYINKHNTWR